MGSYQRSTVYDHLDLQIIDLVYEAAWAEFIARDPSRDTRKDEDRQELLRKKVFAAATAGEVEFGALLDKVMASIPETWTMGAVTRDRSSHQRRARPGPVGEMS